MRVIGVGQRDRGDDAVGLLVAEHLRSAADTIDVVIGGADAAALLVQLEGAVAAIAVDCARGGGPPGAILRLPPDLAGWPQSRSTSSHGNALADALALGLGPYIQQAARQISIWPRTSLALAADSGLDEVDHRSDRRAKSVAGHVMKERI